METVFEKKSLSWDISGGGPAQRFYFLSFEGQQPYVLTKSTFCLHFEKMDYDVKIMTLPTIHYDKMMFCYKQQRFETKY